MDNTGTIINRIAQSGLITIDLADFLPKSKIVFIDLKDFLFQELILKEKEFREKLQALDWAQYTEQVVSIYCSNEAIIPKWAYMLITSQLKPFAKRILFGPKKEAYSLLLKEAIDQIDLSDYNDQRVIIKGCSEEDIPTAAYLYITEKLLPVTKSIMYGEACSNVPIYKSKKL